MATTEERLDAIQVALAENTALTKRLLNAFPNDDPEGHRRYHDSVIEWRELRNKMIRECLIKVAAAGAVAGAFYLLTAVWKLFKISVTQ